MSDNLMREFIETAAENAAMKVANELRKDLSRIHERMVRVENIVGVDSDGTPNGNGIKGALDKVEKRCAVRATTCEEKFVAIKSAANRETKVVNIWKERIKGAAFALGTAGGMVSGILTLHSYLK